MTNCFGGIDLGGTFIKAGLLAPDGRPITRFKVPTNAESGVPAVRKNLVSVGHRLSGEAEKRNLRLAGIGIGTPGTVKYPEGLITGSSPNIPGWVGTSMKRLFSEFPVPVKGDNDANCMGLAESLYGAGKGTESGFYLTIGTGIGGAAVIDGSLVRGATFAAGEFGHTVFKFGGRKYKTGRKGPLEAYVAAPALIKLAKKAMEKHPNSVMKKNLKSLTTVDIFEAFKKGDRAAVEAVSGNAEMIGTAVGSIANLLNPEVIVIGGGVALGGKKYIDLIRKAAFSYAFSSATSDLMIRTARYGNEAGWIGAACLNIVDS
jgi:glucokinase